VIDGAQEYSASDLDRARDDWHFVFAGECSLFRVFEFWRRLPHRRMWASDCHSDVRRDQSGGAAGADGVRWRYQRWVHLHVVRDDGPSRIPYAMARGWRSFLFSASRLQAENCGRPADSLVFSWQRSLAVTGAERKPTSQLYSLFVFFCAVDLMGPERRLRLLRAALDRSPAPRTPPFRAWAYPLDATCFSGSGNRPSR